MITVPESVLAYFRQLDIATAVDQMGKAKEPKIPPSLTWGQLGAFYRARLAALQVPIEYALFLEQLWSVVWSDLPHGWTARNPSDPGEGALSLSVGSVWEAGTFGRMFERGDQVIELYVGLDDKIGVQLGFAVYDGDMLIRSDGLPGWVPYPDTDAVWTGETIVPLAETLVTAPFQRLAEQAWTAIATALQ